ncbi:MAG: phosphoglycerate kinase [Candidatus Woesearchaeota archaeon]
MGSNSFRTLSDIGFSGKSVLIRVDFNVPLKNGKIIDDMRIRQALPTILYVFKRAKRIILISHLGRPDGKKNKEFSLLPVSEQLSRLLDMPVGFVEDCLSENIPDTKIVMLENLRFYPEEEANDPEFAKKLATYGDVFVNDAFGASHRAHASVVAITEFLPACAGLLLEKEIAMLKGAVENPKRPFVAILGGAKVSDKLPVINNLIEKVDKLLLGGAMIFTFYKAQGINVGKSLYEEDCIPIARKLLASSKIVLPVDIVSAAAKDETSPSETTSPDNIRQDYYGLDIGPKSIELFKKHLSNAATVLWNGPLGMFEIRRFAKGTNEIAICLSKLKAVVIIGGGDSAAAIGNLGLTDKISHVSTGGGASLELLEGKVLPAIKALQENRSKFV